MAGSLVIVAVPSENDRVWKVSSEKVPHLTLLFLGEDADEVPNLDQIMLFVEHAANTTLRRFYLPVDRRDELGEGKADVLFFRKDRYDFKAIRDFRGTLLQDPNIKKAYDASSQFEAPEYTGAAGQPWIPHLTLGYPESPAKPEPNDQLGAFYSVEFTKIAVWTGDYEGPEFLLKDYWEDFDMGDIPMDVAMSDIGDLAHFGVKGMRWGVRSAGQKIGGGFKAVGRGLAAMGVFMANSQWQQNAYSDVKHEAVHNHVAKSLDNNIAKLQKSPKYRGKNLKTDSDLRKSYYEDVAKVTDSAYRRGVKEVYGENYTGTKTAHYVSDARGARIEVRDKKSGETVVEAPFTSKRDIERRRNDDELNRVLKQAAETDMPDLSINLYLDDNGQISGVGFVRPSEEDAMKQTAALGVEFLAHYGVKGMRWGVRNRPEPAAVAPSATSKVPHGARRKTQIKTEGGENHPAHEDAVKVARAQAKLKKSGTAALSNQELQELQTRLNLERNVTTLVKDTGRVGKGRKFVRDLTGVNRELNTTVDTGFQTARLARQLRPT